MLKAQHVAELHQEQQHRSHVLETGHHRMRREFIREPSRSSRTALQQPPSRIMAKNTSSVAATSGSPSTVVARCSRIEQQTKKEGRGDTRRVDAGRRSPRAANKTRDHSRDKAAIGAIGEVFVAQCHEGKHAKAIARESRRSTKPGRRNVAARVDVLSMPFVTAAQRRCCAIDGGDVGGGFQRLRLARNACATSSAATSGQEGCPHVVVFADAADF